MQSNPLRKVADSATYGKYSLFCGYYWRIDSPNVQFILEKTRQLYDFFVQVSTTYPLE